MAELKTSYGHLAKLRDEVIAMGVLPEHLVWRVFRAQDSVLFFEAPAKPAWKAAVPVQGNAPSGKPRQKTPDYIRMQGSDIWVRGKETPEESP
jgi:hypothetical protein